MQIDLCAQEQINPWAQAQINPWSQVQIDPWAQAHIDPWAKSRINLEPNEPRCRLTLEHTWWWFMSPYADWVFNPVILWSILNAPVLANDGVYFLIILYQYINIVAIRFTVHRGSWFDMITLVHAQFYTQDINVFIIFIAKLLTTVTRVNCE